MKCLLNYITSYKTTTSYPGAKSVVKTDFTPACVLKSFDLGFLSGQELFLASYPAQKMRFQIRIEKIQT
jgi:hypothetical protein